jgi:hypothetical protein
MPVLGHPALVSTRSRRALAALTFVAGAVAAGCNRAPPPGAERTEALPAATPPRVVGTPTLPAELGAREPERSAAATAAPDGGVAAVPPWTGPVFVVTDVSAGVFADTSFERKQKIGYLRSGGRVPVEPGTIQKDNCARGWYRLRDGGFVCGEAGTTNLNSPEAKFSMRQPDLTAILPYRYARNAKNGTPLYKSVPTAEQMRTYEPYLIKKTDETPNPDGKKSSVDGTAPAGTPLAKTDEAPLPFSKEAIAAAPHQGGELPHPDVEPPRPIAAATEHAEAPDGGADDRPWWQREDADKRLHEVKLDELSADADAVLAKRMVRGFYVAVDREFNWNGRPWYKTTKGLVAPADRFWVTNGSDFHGVELDGDKLALPMGFTYGWQKTRPKYQLDASGNLKPAGTVDRHVAIALTGKDKTFGGKKYLETKDGFYIQANHLRVTEPGPPPVDLGPNERWLDVNLATQTAVAFEGTRAVYATLISSGKESDDKDKDHRTPTGEWRIREKHVTTTMDGDGSAAGDLPYSIEDVPYVQYFYRSYAVHGAFWHANYGSEMSHGCVNLSPLDAKWMFMFTEPHLPEGWHGVWATAAHPGSRVVVHDARSSARATAASAENDTR